MKKPFQIALIALAGIAFGLFAYLAVHRSAHEERVQVILPDGGEINAEVSSSFAAIRQGLKGRDSLDRQAGMLFRYPTPGYHPHWMYQCKIALDMIWLDDGGTVIEIVSNAKPCAGPASACPRYGGNQHNTKYVLELAAGESAQHRLAVHQTIEFDE